MATLPESSGITLTSRKFTNVEDVSVSKYMQSMHELR